MCDKVDENNKCFPSELLITKSSASATELQGDFVEFPSKKDDVHSRPLCMNFRQTGKPAGTLHQKYLGSLLSGAQIFLPHSPAVKEMDSIQ